MPAIAQLLETALYFDDVDGACAFYRDGLGLRELFVSPRLVALDAGQSTVLLLFRRGGTAEGFETGSGWIPPHDGHGPAHLAFAIAAGSEEEWADYLHARGVAIESRVLWPRGGHSLYFRDPGGHSVELVTPGTWATY